jgi:hypothetical protein
LWQTPLPAVPLLPLTRYSALPAAERAATGAFACGDGVFPIDLLLTQWPFF